MKTQRCDLLPELADFLSRCIYRTRFRLAAVTTTPDSVEPSQWVVYILGLPSLIHPVGAF